MESKKFTITLIVIISLIAGCVDTPFDSKKGTTTTTLTKTTTTLPDEYFETFNTKPGDEPGAAQTTTTLPIISPEESITLAAKKIKKETGIDISSFDLARYKETSITSHADQIVSGCTTNECKLQKIHKYAIDNFYYKKSENATGQVIELFTKKNGICTNFMAYYYNYFKSIDLDTYIVVLRDHVYTIACDQDIDRIYSYLEEDPAFMEYTQDHVFRDFEFELNNAFGKECLRIEGPSTTRGSYRYPGEYYGETEYTNNSFIIDPETGNWQRINESSFSLETREAHIVRNKVFTLSEANSLTWRVKKIQKKIDGAYDYEFTAEDFEMTVTPQYLEFGLPETNRFDRLKLRITINATGNFTFFTLKDSNQIEPLKEYMENLKTQSVRVDPSRTGNQAWEFEYLSYCSQPSPATFFDKECIIPDTGRRIYVIHSEEEFTPNTVNLTVEYIDYL